MIKKIKADEFCGQKLVVKTTNAKGVPGPTPEAFANFSPGLELATTLGKPINKQHETLKALASATRVGQRFQR